MTTVNEDPSPAAAAGPEAASDIQRVGVVGAGQMGSGIAEVCARAGLDVRIVEVSGQALEIGRSRLWNSLDRAVERGKLEPAERERLVERLEFTTDITELADRDLVIEAVVENLQVKTELFTALDRVVTRPDAILATNTSSFPIIRIATATSRPQQVLGIHFFNPATVQPLVELIPSMATSTETVERAHALATAVLGKQAIRAGDRAGFVVNALLIPYLLSAVRMYESGFASAEDIDNGMVYGCAHPMGPLRLTDLVGLDTTLAVADSLWEEFREPQYAAPPLLRRMVDAGLLGKKVGRGFYDYTKD
ncbi:3-hydroxybutyryl-CoA dehydrogenase [Allostreptomyces psammosilenae]|uniref:3-hydroxybutyryl-CoA dehydrogenase n=1 Tax=Allostreptomyces psammosilenae TaxID=1892865 RepID=A0A853A0J0_9ACTN|nr:3-hydroxybutyryl-CoA dehydrogenase [Allostreptomyces psammosilenae]NYI04032.1 3-hydroxybutyryl-CoA dehydrogenase [Allostreptomyces psammosilenae]